MRSKPPIWLWAVPILTMGFLAPLPPFVIALKVQSRRAWGWFGAFAATSVLGVVLAGSQPDGADNLWTTLGVAITLGNLVAALTYSGVTGRGVLWGGPAPALAYPPPPPPYRAPYLPPPDANTAAVAAVQEARRKRSDARAIAQRDPHMARDLRIGRPDLPRNFDDGGLVDLNSAPTSVLVQHLDLSEAQAAHVVEVRQELGRFQRADDLVSLAGLDQVLFDGLHDRVVLL